MTDKKLNDPAVVPDKCPGVPAWTFEEGVDPRRCYAAGWRAGVNSEYVKKLEARIALLERNHARLRDGMAEIHNTVVFGRAEQSLAAIREAARNYYDESKLMPAENDGIPPAGQPVQMPRKRVTGYTQHAIQAANSMRDKCIKAVLEAGYPVFGCKLEDFQDKGDAE